MVDRQRSPELPAARGLAEVRSLVGRHCCRAGGAVVHGLRGLRRRGRGGPCPHPRPAGRARPDGRRGRGDLADRRRSDRWLGGSATAAAAAARIRVAGATLPRAAGGLRATVATRGARLRTARESLRGLRARLDRYAKAAVRDERGEIRLPGGWQVGPQDALGGHIVERHGQTQELRSGSQQGTRASLVLRRLVSAERHIAQGLARHGRDRPLARDSRETATIDAVLDEVTGLSASPRVPLTACQGIRIILVRAPGSPSGYRILTAFPQP